MNKKLVFIKLGGGLISDKTKVNRPRLADIEMLAKEIKAIFEKNKDLALLIFTGAGGFGHPVAQKYKNNLQKGLGEIKKAVKTINKIVVSLLVKTGVKAISVEPDRIAEYKNGVLLKLSDDYIVSLLDNKIIPVFHADLVRDKVKGVSVLSMDKFLVDSAIFFNNKGFKIEKVIFAGTTPGVVDRFGRTIPKITKNDLSKIQEIFYKGKGIDVSGGMRYKVEQSLRLADEGIESLVIDGRTTNIFNKTGTVISK